MAAQSHRLAARRGRKRALVAVAHSLLVSVYPWRTRQHESVDLGKDYFDPGDSQAVPKRLVRRLEGLGLTVTVAPAPHAAS